MYIIPITDEQIIFTTAIPNGSGHHHSMCTTTPTYIYKYAALIVIIRFVRFCISVEIELCVVLVLAAVRAPVKEKIIEPHTRRPYIVKVVEASAAAAVCRPQQPAGIEAYIGTAGRVSGQASTKGTFRRVGHTHTHTHNFICYIVVCIYVLYYYYVYFLAGKKNKMTGKE